MNLAWKCFHHSLYQYLLTTQLCDKPKLHLPPPRTCKRRHTFSEVYGMNLTYFKILKFKCHSDDSTLTPEHHRNRPHLLPVYLLPHPHKNCWNREIRRDLEERTKGRNKKENAGLPRKHARTNKSSAHPTSLPLHSQHNHGHHGLEVCMHSQATTRLT